VNLRLEVGDFVQQVTVTEAVPLVNTTAAVVSGVVGEREVKDLPLNGRSFRQPDRVESRRHQLSAMKSANTIPAREIRSPWPGGGPATTCFLLNGIEYTGSSQLAVTPGGVSGELLGIDAVREFNVLTDTYPVEYGKRAGAQINVVTQSGSNTVHGSVFEFLRNSTLDAPQLFRPGVRASLPAAISSECAGRADPENRLFLFGNYEGFRQSLAVSSLSVVPDAQARLGFLPRQFRRRGQVRA